MRKQYIAIAGVLIGMLVTFFVYEGCASFRVGEVVVPSAKDAEEGYALVAPYRVDTAPHETSEGMVYLLNKKGAVLHTWHTPAPVLVAHLMDDGSLYVAMTEALSQSEHPNAGTTGIIQKLSWGGDVLFEHKDSYMMIDFEVLPNGNITYMRWSKTPFWYGMQARGTAVPHGVWANELVEIDPEGKEVWSWKLQEHVSPTVARDSFVPSDDFSHTNSVRYIQENPITHTEAYLVSARHLSTIYLIERNTGNVLWESKKGLLAFQHDATLLPNGHILAFDNGFAREGVSVLASRALEFDMSEQQIVWQYDGGMTGTGKAQFATSIMGGAQRLLNGDTLITLSVPNRVIEVTENGDVAWEYVYTKRDEDGASRMLFKTHLYDGATASWRKYIILPELSNNLFCTAFN